MTLARRTTLLAVAASRHRVFFCTLVLSLAIASLVSAQLGPIKMMPPEVTSVQPSVASSMDHPPMVTIKGNQNLKGATQAVFGSSTSPLSSSSFSDNGVSVLAAPPNQFGTVPVSVILGGHVLPSNATYSYPIGDLEVNGPAWISTLENIPCDPAWTPGDLYSFELAQPGTLYFSTLNPVFHIATAFTDISNTTKGPSPIAPQNLPIYVGNEGRFEGVLFICDLQGPSSIPYGTCKNWDGHDGWWKLVPGGDVGVTLKSSGPGKTTTADLALPASNVFSSGRLAATFSIQAQLWQWDSSNASQAQLCRNVLQKSAPFNVVVSPTAAVQLNTVPYTILYQPPGDMSTASFTATTQYGTQYSLASSNEVDDSYGTEQSSSTNFGIKMAFGLLSSDLSSENDWDQKTMQTFGTVNNSMNSSSDAAAFGLQESIPADNNLIPGSGTVCAQPTSCATTMQETDIYEREPFWDDVFYLVVHPQFFVWVLGGQQDRWVLYGATPTLVDIDVAQLDNCVQGRSWYGQTGCYIPYAAVNLTNPNGQPLNWTTTTGSVTLGAAEAADLLSLDPFYAAGQGASLPATRVSPLPGSLAFNYGGTIIEKNGSWVGSPPNAHMATYSNTEASQTGSGTQTSASLSTTTVWGSKTSAGVTLGFSGSTGSGAGGTSVSASGGVTLGSGFQTTEGTAVKITFQNSTAVSNQVVTSISATLNDADDNPNPGGGNCSKCHDPLPNRPSVAIYFDKVFGSYMFVDPYAPASYNRGKLPKCCTMFIKSLYRRELRHPRFSDVASTNSAEGAIGLMARIQVVPGNSDGTFHPNDPFTREELATALSVALHLPRLGIAHPTNFLDVQTTDKAAGDIAAVADKNLIPVASTTRFQPLDAVTRQDFAAALANAFHLQGQGPFTDASGLPAATQESISAVLSKGYMTLSNGLFQPNGILSRAEAAQSLFLAIRDYAASGSPQ